MFCMGRGVNQNRSRPVTGKGPQTKYMVPFMFLQQRLFRMARMPNQKC